MNKMLAHLRQANWHVLSDYVSDIRRTRSHLHLEILRLLALSSNFCVYIFLLRNQFIRVFLCLHRAPFDEQSESSPLRFKQRTYLLLGSNLFLYGIHFFAKLAGIIVHCNTEN